MVFVPLISSCVFSLIQNLNEVPSEILFSINLIIGIFSLKPLFKGFSFVFRQHVCVDRFDFSLPLCAATYLPLWRRTARRPRIPPLRDCRTVMDRLSATLPGMGNAKLPIMDLYNLFSKYILYAL